MNEFKIGDTVYFLKKENKHNTLVKGEVLLVNKKSEGYEEWGGDYTVKKEYASSYVLDKEECYQSPLDFIKKVTGIDIQILTEEEKLHRDACILAKVTPMSYEYATQAIKSIKQALKTI